MLFPFRSSSIFRNRWIALLWAVGICFTATEIVDTLSGVTAKDKARSTATSTGPDDAGDPVAAMLGSSSSTAPPPGGPPALPEQAR